MALLSKENTLSQLVLGRYIAAERHPNLVRGLDLVWSRLLRITRGCRVTWQVIDFRPCVNHHRSTKSAIEASLFHPMIFHVRFSSGFGTSVLQPHKCIMAEVAVWISPANQVDPRNHLVQLSDATGLRYVVDEEWAEPRTGYPYCNVWLELAEFFRTRIHVSPSPNQRLLA